MQTNVLRSLVSPSVGWTQPVANVTVCYLRKKDVMQNGECYFEDSD